MKICRCSAVCKAPTRIEALVRKIELRECRQVTWDFGVLQLIAENVPEIESINDCLNSNHHTTKASIFLVACGNSNHSLCRCGIALDHLHLKLQRSTSTKLEFVNGICKLNTFQFGLRSFLFLCHFLGICKSLSDLLKLHLDYEGRDQSHDLAQKLVMMYSIIKTEKLFSSAE